MGRFTLFALLVPALAALAAPVPSKRAAFSFALQSYDQFQISSGVAGTAEAEANAVFVDPFPADLTTVDATSLDNLGTMREAAESAETDLFNPQIAAASGAAADALQVGKIKNKVLKLTGEVQQIKIKIAQATAAGEDTSSLEDDLATEQTKLSNNIATDVKSAGAASQAVAGSAVAAPAAADPVASPAATTKAATTAAATTAAAAASTVVAAATPGAFALLDYSQFQISSGVAGTAEAEANAVFVTPFPADLTTVDATSLDNLGTMREAAESAETDLFNPQIAAASGAAADALQVGKIKNKVLKLTGEVQQIKIRIAQAAVAGEDTSSLETDLATEQTKLATNIATDVKSAGAASQAVA
ncbi:hypothetical protein DFH09DRAFT_1071545 [Mycena vulgaris]|nr:hypothetical protein DFH09DRAFT_1071545 [Mycena vulgaris]